MLKRFPVTVSLLVLNVIAFAIIALIQQSIMMDTGADVLAILNAGGNLNPFTLDGQPWRIVTSMFLHFGIVHLAVNMYALYGLGSVLEPGVGSVRFLIVYFICGIVAGLTSLFFNVYVISAGASGAIFGLYGYQLGAELIGSFNDRDKLKNVLINFGIFIVVNAFIAGQVNVDMWGHIGGGVAGLAMAFLHFKAGLLKSKVSLAIVLVLLPFVVFFVPKDQLNYYKVFQRVLNQEDYIGKLFREVKDEKVLADSLKNVRDEWKAIQRSLRELTDVPLKVVEDTAVLSRYVGLREKETGYRINLLERESYIYLDSIEILPAKFDSLPKFKHILVYELPDEEEEVQQEDTTEQNIPNVKTARVFYDKDWKEIDDPVSALYYRIGTRDSLGRWQGSVRDFYRSGDIQMKGSYKDGLRHGIFIYYSDHKTYTSAGRYEKENAVGKWETFHWNGRLQSEVFYSPDVFTSNTWDSLGNPQVENGGGKHTAWHPNGKIAEEGEYVGGERQGYWYGYHENGKPYYRELYRDNRMVSGASEDLNGKRYVYDQFSQLPFPVIGMQKYNEYLRKNVRRPEGTDTSGVVKVLFNVGVDGSLWDFVILDSSCDVCNEEAIRLVREGPPWRPALLHGNQKILSQGYVEVHF